MQEGEPQSILSPEQQSGVDWFVLTVIWAMLAYSGILLTNAYYSGFDIGSWIWSRHQNLFSWYSRPLFVIPACYYAYRRKIGFVVGIMALLATSLFWFAPPAEVSETVSGYLEWERKAFLDPKNRMSLIILVLAVATFLSCLFWAFWNRSVWLGWFVINIGNLLKILVSVMFGGDAGTAAIVPTLSSMLVINFVAFAVWKWRKRVLTQRRSPPKEQAKS